MKPTRDEIEGLTKSLLYDYHISTRFINILIKETGSYHQLTDIIGNELSNEEKIQLLIHQKESRLFSGSGKRTVELRSKLIGKLPVETTNKSSTIACAINRRSKGSRWAKVSMRN